MPHQQTSCVHRGNTFFGDVEVDGSGPSRTVRVRYNGDEGVARVDDLTVEIVAHLLLTELVLREFDVLNSRAAGMAGDGRRPGQSEAPLSQRATRRVR